MVFEVIMPAEVAVSSVVVLEAIAAVLSASAGVVDLIIVLLGDFRVFFDNISVRIRDW